MTWRSVPFRRALELIRHPLRPGFEPLLLGAAMVLPRAAGLLTVPLYARVLGPEDFGRYELLISLAVLLASVATLGLDFALSVRYFNQHEPERRRDLGSAVCVVALVASVLTAAMVSVGIISGYSGTIGEEQWSSAVLMSIAVPLNAVAATLVTHHRLTFRGRGLFTSMVLGTSGGTALGLILVGSFDGGLLGAAIGFLAAQALTLVCLVITARRSILTATADARTAWSLVRLGAPLVPAAAATWVFALSDRVFIAAILDVRQLGLYAAAARVTVLLVLLVVGFQAAWGPMALQRASMPHRDEFYAQSLRVMVTIGGGVVVVTSWLAVPLLYLVAGPAFVQAADVIWLLAASALLSSMFSVVRIGASIGHRGGLVASATILAALVNTAANVMLIPTVGYLGAGIATLLTYAVAFGLMYAMSQRVTRIRFQVLRPTIAAAGWTALAGASVIVPAPARPLLTVIVVASALIVIAVAAGSTLRSGLEPEPIRARD